MVTAFHLIWADWAIPFRVALYPQIRALELHFGPVIMRVWKKPKKAVGADPYLQTR